MKTRYKMSRNGWSYSQHVDIDGNPVERPREKYPYSYDPYVIHKKGDNYNAVVYSDRLCQWSYDKYQKCKRDVWGTESDYFDEKSFCSLEKFLQLYMENDNLELIAVTQGANMSTGYPYWVFYYNTNDKKDEHKH